MKNMVLWGIQSTVDRTFNVGEDMEKVVGKFISMGLFEKYHPLLNAVQTTGQNRDITINLEPTDPRSLADIRKASDYLQKSRKHRKGRLYRNTEQIGGDPAIAALRAHRLLGGNDGSPLPHVRYVGLLPQSVREFMRRQDPQTRHELEQVFNPANCIEIDAEPETLSIEAQHKIIISYGPGRTVKDLAPNGDFSEYCEKLKRAAGSFAGRVVVAMSIPWPQDLGARMMQAVQNTFPHVGGIFLAIKSFRKETGGALDKERARDVYRLLLPHVDLFSLNETELHDLHTVVLGNMNYQELALPNKLKELDCHAIKVCHSADGAILEVGCDPQRIINSEKFAEKPGEYLQQSLQWAVDGAAYAIDSIEQVGRMASEPMVRIYSSSVGDRSDDLFRVTFLKTVDRLPSGIISAHAPLVGRHLAAVTGVGAMFDGLLLSFLMRD
jgi:hypothetical protein